MSALDIVEKLTRWSPRAKKGERRLILEARAEIRSLRLSLLRTHLQKKRLEQEVRILTEENERFRREIEDRDQIVTKQEISE